MNNNFGGGTEPSEHSSLRLSESGLNICDGLGMTALETVIDWISDFNYHARHDQMAKLRFYGTGRWFIETEEYRTWVNSSCGKLWVNAIRTCALPLRSHRRSPLPPQLEQGRQYWRKRFPTHPLEHREVLTTY